MTKETTNNELARMVAEGFKETHNRISQVDNKIDRVDNKTGSLKAEMNERFNYTNARLDSIERDVSEIRRNFVYRPEFDDLMARVKYVEEKIGIDSGK